MSTTVTPVAAAAVAFVNAVLVCVVAFGVSLTENQIGVIMGAVNAGAALGFAFYAAYRHDPNPASAAK